MTPVLHEQRTYMLDGLRAWDCMFLEMLGNAELRYVLSCGRVALRVELVVYFGLVATSLPVSGCILLVG